MGERRDAANAMRQQGWCVWESLVMLFWVILKTYLQKEDRVERPVGDPHASQVSYNHSLCLCGSCIIDFVVPRTLRPWGEHPSHFHH